MEWLHGSCLCSVEVRNDSAALAHPAGAIERGWMKDPYLSIVIPAYNEQDNVAKVVEHSVSVLKTHVHSYEILLVNDGSSDDTFAAMQRLAAADADTIVALTHTTNRGLGAALRTGFARARGEIVLWIPGDGQFDLSDILKGLPQMTTQDIVVVLRQGRKEATRSFISTCFHELIRLLFQFEATDLCGIYLIKRPLLERIHPRSEDVFLNLEIPLLCVREGKQLGKITAAIRPRLSGSSKVANLRTLTKNMYELLKFRFTV
jgi:glycosyltransferase involved in cell wall biosynthesis